MNKKKQKANIIGFKAWRLLKRIFILKKVRHQKHLKRTKKILKMKHYVGQQYLKLRSS